MITNRLSSIIQPFLYISVLGIMFSSYVISAEVDSFDDEVGIESLYPRGEELGPLLVQSQKDPSEGIWTFAAEKDKCSEFIIAPTQKGIDSAVQAAFFWYNNTPDHPDYASSTSGGWIKKEQNKWYPLVDVQKKVGRLMQVRYNDAKHTTRGTKRHHNFQMKFRVNENGKWRILSHRGDDQRQYVRFLMSSARPEILPGEFDGGRGRDEPIYTANEWNTLLLQTTVIPDDKYADVRAAQNDLEDLNEGIEKGEFTAEQVQAEIERQESGESQHIANEELAGSQAALSTLVAAGLASAKKIGQKLVEKGEEAATLGLINFFKGLLTEGCTSSTSISQSDEITKVTLHDKAGQ